MADQQKLRVAPPRARNPQLSDQGSATIQHDSATANATVDLKALAGKRLEHINRNPGRNQGATDSGKGAQLSPSKTTPKVAPAAGDELDTIIHVLMDQVGRDLGSDLDRRMRHVMAPMDRKGRAELAAALDDAFEVAGSVEAARWQCHRLLSDAKALAEAKAAWPGYPRGNT